MVDLKLNISEAFDPSAESKDSSAASTSYVHIRIYERSNMTTLTKIQGLPKEYSYSKILRDLKKEFRCRGDVIKDKELGLIIQLSGDQRKNVHTFLVSVKNLVHRENIKVHGS
ncbi:protein translation factor SUI1 homolog 2-like [Mercurialis annua]|uniref:protein translation factor SUI1 homolog 2-like n=1 Tax=Mercurialis annua TaxID=3986 RepID=UPI0021608B40|nr:protein translation factor SUI1 homolog 2-like [Mercurialis annua]